MKPLTEIPEKSFKFSRSLKSYFERMPGGIPEGIRAGISENFKKGIFEKKTSMEFLQMSHEVLLT